MNAVHTTSPQRRERKFFDSADWQLERQKVQPRGTPATELAPHPALFRIRSPGSPKLRS